jgi:hypothetical protein
MSSVTPWEENVDKLVHWLVAATVLATTFSSPDTVSTILLSSKLEIYGLSYASATCIFGVAQVWQKVSRSHRSKAKKREDRFKPKDDESKPESDSEH